ncbi:uncharacterized protein FRV6_04778 [Fusarium oxysporum]|uniref:Uncharacterized protein n=1 Tax=Fusarium oxysporum TaxID=5507 RepID=A0A2H3T4H1_FUSOX|nr:uncharacterized protein FRV6_04778 [Fusarium oxysporum]
MSSSANLQSILQKCSLYAVSQQSSDRIARTLRMNSLHILLLYAALKKDEWLLAVKNLKILLKPDGYLFWSEIEAYGYASNPYSAALHEWKSIESAEAVKFGRDPM